MDNSEKHGRKARPLRVVFVLTAVAAGTVLTLSGCKPQAAPPEEAPAVTVSEPVQRQAADHLELVGNTRAVNTVMLVARVPGYLDKVFFKDGQVVSKDQLLFMIQEDTYRAKLKEAEGQITAQQALLDYAHTQLSRDKTLSREKAISQADVDNWRYQHDSAEANLKIARAARDLASLDLSYTQVTAPFAGRIDRRLKDPGNFVGTGADNMSLAQLTQMDPLYVYFTISDTDLARLVKEKNSPSPSGAPEGKVRIGLVGEDGFPHEGTLDFSSPTVSATSGTSLMRAVMPNPSGTILPGTYARILVPFEEQTVWTVPEEAVIRDQLGPYVLVVDQNNRAERRDIKTGFSIDRLRVVEQGLRGHERIITQGLIKVTPGHKVTPVQETKAPGVPS